MNDSLIICHPKELSEVVGHQKIFIDYQGNEALVFSLNASYVGEGEAIICFEITTDDGKMLYLSHNYTPYDKDGKTKEWLIPSYCAKGVKRIVHIKVPEGCQLSISDYSLRVAKRLPYGKDRAIFDAHLGFYGIAPENTKSAFIMAGECGFDSCIANLRKTKDGVFVCIHDETINRTARDSNENPPTEPLRVEDLTYEELLKWDFGLYKYPCYKGEQVATVEEFFEICKKYGMKPYFSTGNGVTVQEWQEIRKLLEKHGLLSSLKLKTYYKEPEALKTFFSVFGNEIYQYTLWGFKFEEDMPALLEAGGFDKTKVRGVIEIHEKVDTNNITPQAVKAIAAAGFHASAVSCWNRNTGEYYSRLIGMGVSEFTEDYHCSFGLNW